MKLRIEPHPLSGSLPAIPSKSHVHRLLICTALSKQGGTLPCPVFSQDIAATVRCLQALGADIATGADGCTVSPLRRKPDTPAVLCCGESGSTYRFLAPVACALGIDAVFRLSGKLPQRPMTPLWQALEAHGAKISGKGSAAPEISGQLTAGCFTISGDISSQFLTGLLFALPLLKGDSRLVITGKLQSKGYLQLTLDTLRAFSIAIRPTADGFFISGGQRYHTPPTLCPEGDWSNAAFWLCAAACTGSGITMTGLSPDSAQADRAVCRILQQFGAFVSSDGNAVTVRPAPLHPVRLDAGDIPDLIPAVAVAAAAATGDTVIENAGRLRMKESDRIATVCAALNTLGGSAESTADTIVIHGRGHLRGGCADACGDHRIAMLLSAASVLCREPVTICGAEAVEKSYPTFFEDLAALGGCVIKGVDAP